MYNERRSFLFFLFLVLATAGIVADKSVNSTLFAIFAIMWGLFGFFRLVYFMQDNSSKSQNIINLPSRILFGMDERALERRDSVLNRLTHRDIRFWFFGICIFFVWAFFCSMSPENIPLVADLHAKQSALLNNEISYTANLYMITQSFTQYGVIAIIIFIAFTYSLSRTHIRWAFYTLFPIFCVSMVYLLLSVGWANLPIFPDAYSLKGGGLGLSFIMDILAKPIMDQSGTGLFKRYVELGCIGAYGAYVLFLPSLLLIISVILNPMRSTIRPFLGLLVLISLAITDMFWIFSPLTLALLILALPVIVLCWGSAGFHGSARGQPQLPNI